MANTVINRKILFVEDELSVLLPLTEYFESSGNQCFCASTLNEAKRLIRAEELDAIVLDRLLPDGDGLELFETGQVLPPVIVLSHLNTEADMISGFFAGAVDYIPKPCSPQLLEMRLALRMRPKREADITVQNIRVNLTERTAAYRNIPLTLTVSEFNILCFFMTHAGIFFTSSQIYENVWKAPSLQTTTVKYHISNLRKKLKDVAGKNLIVTEFGRGYSLAPEEPIR